MTSYERMLKNLQGQKLFGKYRGFVVDIEDLDAGLKIRANVPRIQEKFVTTWAFPCGISRNNFEYPEIQDLVYIEFEGGDARFPIWTYGPIPFGKARKDSKVAPASNVSHGRKIVGHANNSALILDGSQGNEAVYLIDMEGKSKMGVSSRQGSLFLIGERGAVISVKDNLDESIGGSRDTGIGGNKSEAIAGSSSSSIAEDREQTVGANDLLIVNDKLRYRAGKEAGFDVVNSAGIVQSSVFIDNTGKCIITSFTNGVEAAKIEMTSSGQVDITGNAQIGIDATADLTVNGALVKLGSGAVEPVAKGASLNGILNQILVLIQTLVPITTVIGVPTTPNPANVAAAIAIQAQLATILSNKVVTE